MKKNSVKTFYRIFFREFLKEQYLGVEIEGKKWKTFDCEYFLINVEICDRTALGKLLWFTKIAA